MTMKLASEIYEGLSDRFYHHSHERDEVESIIDAKLEPVKLALMSIIKLDRTPPYGYGQVAPNGDLPPSGDRWVTPRERAQAVLAMLSNDEETKP